MAQINDKAMEVAVNTLIDTVTTAVEKIFDKIADAAANFLGGMSLQDIAKIHEDDIDALILKKQRLEELEYVGGRFFINYMDDFVIIHHDKEYLNYCLDVVREKLLNDYKLELNRKTRIYNINEGIEFLGYRYILKNNKVIIKLRSITKKNFKKNVRMINLLKNYNYIDNEKYKLLLNGYKGVLSKGNCSNLFRSIVYD